MRTKTDYIVIHCAATPARMDVDIATVAEWHKERGFNSVGYHYFIKRDGSLQLGRDLHEIGAHVVGFNHNSVGICMAGGMDAENKNPQNNFTANQWDTLDIILNSLHQEFPKAVIVGHHDLNPGKACPSFSVSEYVADKPELSPEV